MKNLALACTDSCCPSHYGLFCTVHVHLPQASYEHLFAISKNSTAAGCHLQFNDNVKFGTAFKHFVQFHDAVVVHSLTHDINLHQDFIAARFASSTFLQNCRGKLLPSLLTCATFHDRKLTPATRKREFIYYNPVAGHGLSTIATHRPSSDPTS